MRRKRGRTQALATEGSRHGKAHVHCSVDPAAELHMQEQSEAAQPHESPPVHADGRGWQAADTLELSQQLPGGTT